ncbi:MAG: lysophospholipid acyltransferase family protein [Clostridia bacterium]|nr:lysophospholipid acyltransferase family protein [Clostridia bacterium]
MKKIVKWLIKIFLCHLFYRVKYIGADKIKDMNRCVICPNHSNTVEPAWLYARNDDITIMAKAELFEKKFWAKIFTYFNVFPINRGEHDIRSIMHAINLFKNVEKRKLLVFPEGERLKKDIDRISAKVGPVYIAMKANVPIIPVSITKNVKLFSRVNIIYGDPITVPEELLKDKEKLQQFADRMMDDIYAMGAEYIKRGKK